MCIICIANPCTQEIAAAKKKEAKPKAESNESSLLVLDDCKCG